MKSFEQPIEYWRQLENNLQHLLTEVDEFKNGFADMESKLLHAIDQFHKLDLFVSIGSSLSKHDIDYFPIPQEEALIFAKRHTGESSEAGYRSMLQRITTEYHTMRLSGDFLKDIHKHIMGKTALDAGTWKESSNYIPWFREDGTWYLSIRTVPPQLVPEYISELHDRFYPLWNAKAVHPLLLIAAYSLDLFCIHPFRDGNGRTVRLAILLLLHQVNYCIGKYISLEGAIPRTRSQYGRTLNTVREKWWNGEHDLEEWCCYLINVIRTCFAEMFTRTDELSVSAEQFTSIAQVIDGMPNSFNLSDVKSELPGIPNTTIKIIMNRMRENEMLQTTLYKGEIKWTKTSRSG